MQNLRMDSEKSTFEVLISAIFIIIGTFLFCTFMSAFVVVVALLFVQEYILGFEIKKQELYVLAVGVFVTGYVLGKKRYEYDQYWKKHDSLRIMVYIFIIIVFNINYIFGIILITGLYAGHLYFNSYEVTADISEWNQRQRQLADNKRDFRFDPTFYQVKNNKNEIQWTMVWLSREDKWTTDFYKTKEECEAIYPLRRDHVLSMLEGRVEWFEKRSVNTPFRGFQD